MGVMQILKEDVPFNEILAHYEQEHRGWEGYSIGLDYLNAANDRCQGRWTLVLLSRADIVSVTLPAYNHPIEVILEYANGILKHVDGVHRLLAYAQFDKEEAVLAYVAGLILPVT
jgi:hypothetical protein